MKILILALSGIGDALMFTPSVILLNKHIPEAQIDALVMFRGVKDIYERINLINEVHYFNFLKEGRISSLKYVAGLRKNYDVTINVYPSNRKEYNIISRIIGAKKRCGVKYLRRDFQNLGWINNIRITESDSRHNVQTNILLCQKLLGIKNSDEPSLMFPLNNEDEIFAQKFLAVNKILNDDLVIGFHPGCATLKNHIKRRWEPQKFVQLGKTLIENRKAKILLFGGPDEEELKNEISKGIGASNFVVNTDNLAQTAALMKRCKVFITNDSSLMHVAAAMQLNVIAIIGPTNPAYIHPWKTKHKLVTLNLDCAPCFFYSPRPLKCYRDDIKFKCIKELSVEMVYHEAAEFLSEDL